MDLIIDAYGTYIGASGERIVLGLPVKPGQNVSKRKRRKRGEGRAPLKRVKKEYPIRRLEKIIILRPASISTHAVKLAIENDVDIVYLGAFGKPIGRIFGSDARGIATVRRAQLEAATDPAQALFLAKRFVAAKCRNQIAYMAFLMAKYGSNFEREILQAETLLKTINLLPPGEKAREQLLGIEGYIADRYWRAIGQLHRFPGRIPQGRDKFNSAINYGYGILYNEVERVCLYVGLDPYLGLYHSERYGKPSLVLDLVEEFRVPVVDSAVIPLFIEKKIGKAGDFIEIAKGQYQLSPEGKAKIVKAVFDNLNKKVSWKRKQRSLKDIIKEQSRSLSRYFLQKDPSYQGFDYPRML
ncbi:MAG TPA: CRISPR-associated endonuclease Cas1 [Candidatus Paceibacterota bacterium]|nr:CRISPR-associated endonuclease Cas1 [Candidatus Paceibacterota bacterium]